MALLGLVVIVLVAVVVIGAGIAFVRVAHENKRLSMNNERLAYAAGRSEQALVDLISLGGILGDSEQTVAVALQQLRRDLEPILNNNQDN